jgi:hypothetical protein
MDNLRLRPGLVANRLAQVGIDGAFTLLALAAPLVE